MEKDFNGWHRLKAHINRHRKRPSFNQRDIWWCCIGVNIGHEEDGKSELFSRPVLIVRKFNPHIFWGVPLTTQIKESPYYHRIHFKEQDQCLMLSQLRLWESNRLTRKMGQLSDHQFNEVREALRRMI